MHGLIETLFYLKNACMHRNQKWNAHNDIECNTSVLLICCGNYINDSINKSTAVNLCSKSLKCQALIETHFDLKKGMRVSQSKMECIQ